MVQILAVVHLKARLGVKAIQIPILRGNLRKQPSAQIRRLRAQLLRPRQQRAEKQVAPRRLRIQLHINMQRRFGIHLRLVEKGDGAHAHFDHLIVGDKEAIFRRYALIRGDRVCQMHAYSSVRY